MKEDLARNLRARETYILEDAGFELEEEDFWRKGAVLFGRGAALQNALLELHEDGRDNTLARNWVF